MKAGARKVSKFGTKGNFLRIKPRKPNTFDFPQQVPKRLLAEYLKQQNDCIVPTPFGGLDSIKGLEGDSGNEWLLEVSVSRESACYFLAVKAGRSDGWSISEINESDPRIRERVPKTSSQSKESNQRPQNFMIGGEDLTPEMLRADKSPSVVDLGIEQIEPTELPDRKRRNSGVAEKRGPNLEVLRPRHDDVSHLIEEVKSLSAKNDRLQKELDDSSLDRQLGNLVARGFGIGIRLCITVFLVMLVSSSFGDSGFAIAAILSFAPVAVLVEWIWIRITRRD